MKWSFYQIESKYEILSLDLFLWNGKLHTYILKGKNITESFGSKHFHLWIYVYLFNFRIECVQFGNFFGRPNKYKEHKQKKGPSHKDQCAQCSRNFLTHKEYKTHTLVDEHYGKWKYKCFFTVSTFVLPLPIMFFDYVHIVFFVHKIFSLTLCTLIVLVRPFFSLCS